jgi:hypothetical protein
MQSGTVTVGTSPTLICTLASQGDGVLIQNSGSNPVFVGDPTVAASGANAGIQVAAGETLTIPGVHSGAPSFAPPLYGVVATGTTTVAYIAPAE